MGMIKDGKIYGNLPSEEAFAVHYPAYPSSMERAIQTLGGTQAIAKARASGTNKLELRFRPEDPYSHPASGGLQLCNNFLLKISKIDADNTLEDGVRNRVSKGLSSENSRSLEEQKSFKVLNQNAEKHIQPPTELVASDGQIEHSVPQETEDHFTADIIACVPEAYHFNGMADYQHIPAIHADVARKNKKNYAEIENGGLIMDVDQEDFVIILPPLFSLKDLPSNVVLGEPPVTNNLKRKHVEVADRYWECDIEPSLALDFFIEEIPKKVNWEKHIARDSKQWMWQKAVCELFDERPIWNKNSLCERLLDRGLEFAGNMLRKLLFRAAYYFSNGPFLRFWIRKGYDPRKDPESRIYQRTDFRVPTSLRTYRDSNLASGFKQWRDICNFKIFPYKYFTSFQLLELADDYIQEEIRKPPIRATCSCATGWFSSTVIDSFRSCVAVRFLSLYTEDAAKDGAKDGEKELKSANKRFKTSKSSCISSKEVQQSEGQEASTEVIDNEDNEPNHSEEEEDDDDEIEDDNVEDDIDTYDALDLDGKFSPRQHSDDMDENLSRNFLQELFVNFPDSGVGDNEPSRANGGDGEYHIYEQNSDCSDDNEYIKS